MEILKKKTIEELKEELEREKIKSQIRVEKEGLKTEITELKQKGKSTAFFNGLAKVGKVVGKGMMATGKVVGKGMLTTGKAVGKSIEKMPGTHGNMPGFEEEPKSKEKKKKEKKEFDPFGGNPFGGGL